MTVAVSTKGFRSEYLHQFSPPTDAPSPVMPGRHTLSSLPAPCTVEDIMEKSVFAAAVFSDCPPFSKSMSMPCAHGYFARIRSSSDKKTALAPFILFRRAVNTLEAPSFRMVSIHFRCGHLERTAAKLAGLMPSSVMEPELPAINEKMPMWVILSLWLFNVSHMRWLPWNVHM